MNRLFVCTTIVVLAAVMPRPVEAQLPKAVNDLLDRNVEDVLKALETAENRLRALAKKWHLEGRNEDAEALSRVLEDQFLEKKLLSKLQESVPRERILPKLTGSWAHPNSKLVRIVEPDGKMREVTRIGQHNAAGQCIEKEPGVVRVKLDNDYELEIRMLGEHRIAALIWGPGGALHDVGEVMDRVVHQAPGAPAR